MAKKWKPRQQKAIDWQQGEVIVSASAGTGKTSVLIERAWQIVHSKRANIDEIMAVTFTEDAAEELKSRFRTRLDEEIIKADNPDARAFLREQLHRLDRAQISTIHALCRRIIHENYHQLGISENIEMFATEQATLLKHQTVEKVLEDAYEDDSEFGNQFRELVDRFGGSQIDNDISKMILQIHNFLGSQAEPTKWLSETRELAKKYRSDDFQIGELPAYQYLKHHWLCIIENAASAFAQLTGSASNHNHDRVNTYLIGLTELANHWLTLLKADDHQALASNAEIALPRSPQIRKDEEKIWWSPIQQQVDAVKDDLKVLAKEFTEAFNEDVIECLRNQSSHIETLLELLCRFTEKYELTKSHIGQLEFDDLQRLAMQVLRENNEQTAKHYRELFKFVMVDEYQDINELQDTIIRLICKPTDGHGDRYSNLFMVGDVKQSIYRFRQAEPEIFQSLYRLAKDDGAISRIDLADNFRSRRVVLDSVNSIFTPILTGGDLELEYDEANQLIYGGDFPQIEQNLATEFHILERKLDVDAHSNNSEDDHNKLAEMDALNREAWLSAKKISDLIDSKFQIKNGDELKAVEAKDIVILLRSVRNTAGKYVNMLRRFGISAHCPQMEAFMEYPEIADMVSLLRIIDNPFHDIPLATVLRSPFVGATIDELSQIKLAAGKEHFYSGLINFVRDNPLSLAGQKFQKFLDQYEHWRRRANCCCVAELISDIYLETHYPDLIKAISTESNSGENLEQFLELAWQFNNDEGNDLRDFIEYLSILEGSPSAVQGVQASLKAGVKIMSIHASKGLEFPVVLLGNLGKKVNFQDIQQDLLIDRNLLLGLKNAADMGLNKTNTLPVLAIKKRVRNQSIAEELRLLYVAMTRAKEKLIMVGSGEEKTLSKMLDSISAKDDRRFEPEIITQKDNPVAWITTALSAKHENKFAIRNLITSETAAEIENEKILVSYYPPSEQLNWPISKSSDISKLPSAENLLTKIDAGQTVLEPKYQARIEKANDILDWQYPHKKLCETPTIFSVTELTHRASNHLAAVAVDGDAMDQAKPLGYKAVNFPNDTNHKAIERGNAWHLFMEKIDLNQSLDEENLTHQLTTLVRNKILTLGEANLIEIHKVKQFFESMPGKLMLRHKESLYRELAFTFLLKANDFPEKIAASATEEPILIQGIIDCLATTETGFIIIDYKTNAINASEVDKMTTHYQTQIELYSKAMSEILNKPVESAWLYFSEPDSAMQVI